MAHVEGLFQNAPQTRKITELKEEIMSNCNCRYDDLIAGGATPDEAFKTVIAGIGDVSELIAQLETGKSPDSKLVEEEMKKRALRVSIAVGLFILSPTWYILFNWLRVPSELAVLMMFACIIGGVGLLIYNGMTKAAYNKADDTMVEEFKEWQSQKDQKKSLRNNISAIIWPLILILYFVISFATMRWYITWVIFIAGAMIEAIVSIIFDLRKDKK